MTDGAGAGSAGDPAARPDPGAVRAEGDSMPQSMLVSAAYDNRARSAVLKFYDPKAGTVRLWTDRTGHRPYCYSRLPPADLDNVSGMSGVVSVEPAGLYDPLRDEKVQVSKITAADPLVIGGRDGSVRNVVETWESDIKYYETYLYDAGLVVGRYYAAEGGRIEERDMEVPAGVRDALKTLLWDRVSYDDMVDPAEFRAFAEEWADLLSQPIPHVRRLAFDIEVDSEEGRIPDARLADRQVTAVGFDGSGGYKRVFVLRRDGAEEGRRELAGDVDVVVYDDEKEMVRDALAAIESFPFVLTYNGDDFDMCTCSTGPSASGYRAPRTRCT